VLLHDATYLTAAWSARPHHTYSVPVAGSSCTGELPLAGAISACGSRAGELISDGGVGIPSVSIAGSAGDAAGALIPSALGVSAAVSSTAGVVEVVVSALGATGVDEPLGVSDITLPEAPTAFKRRSSR
jgi:hypothetical protein